MRKFQNLIGFYFILTYAVTVILTTYTPQVSIVYDLLWVLPFAFWVFCFVVNILRRNELYNLWLSKTSKMNIYFMGFGIIMIFTNLSSLNIGYSILTGIFSVVLLALMFNVIGPFLIQSSLHINFKKLISNTLLVILFFAMIGSIVIPSFAWDSGIRISGGVNPNTLALIALFSFVWFWDLKIEKTLPWHNNIGVIISVIVLVATLSRSRILAFGLLVVYLVLWNLYIYISPKLNYRFSKNKALMNGIATIMGLFVCGVLLLFLLNNENILTRLTTSIDSRENVWLMLKAQISDNFLFGPLGWWNANELIKQTEFDADTASSAHNLYLRVLAEIGFVGLLGMLLLPLLLIFNSIKSVVFNLKISLVKRKKLILYSGAIIVFFASQFFEDQYLNGIGDFQTGLFAWILTMSYYYLKETELIRAMNGTNKVEEN